MARSSSSSLLFPFVLLGSFLYSLCPREAFFLPSSRRPEPTAQEAAGPSSSRRSLLAGALAVAAPERANALTTEELRAANLFMTASPSVLSVSEGKKNAVGPTGTGFVWDASHVVTNFHVVKELKSPHVTFLRKDESGSEDHITVGAYVVGADPLSDIAILQVNAEENADVASLMQPLSRGASEHLKPGQEVFALGNPFGLEHSMSKGVISGVSRSMEGTAGWPMSGIIQTDASINPGNSGGPLLNSEGSVVGVNTAILSTSGTFSGVGFALPIDTVQKNVESMIEEGYVTRPSIGVELAPDEVSESLGVPGAMVMKVVPGGPAQRAGMRALRSGQLGDVIVKMGSRPIASSSDVFRYLDQQKPGELVVMSVQRASSDLTSDDPDIVDITVRLGRSNSKMVVT
ncbi:DEGP1 [Symbiodinium microadriaticum]|nr:DEGP1 [Symbiodinium microadriaticum]